MSNEDEIYLPDTSIKFSALKKQLNDVYNLQVISKDKLYICIAITISFIVIYKYIKND